jgi:hypothetical protein
MDNVKGGQTKLVLDASHPEEVARRAAIHPHYDEVIAVNLGSSSSRAEGFSPGGRANMIGGTRYGVKNPSI